MSSYKICLNSDPVKLEQEIEQLCNGGYVIVGGVGFSDRKGLFMQAVIKYDYPTFNTSSAATDVKVLPLSYSDSAV